VGRFTLEILPEAEEEFRRSFLWYFERSPIAADAFRSEVIEAIDSLTGTANQWPANEDGIHYHVLNHYPYTIWYDLLENHATVLAIAHQRRRPGYWTDRIS
jgi:plasmid stabilization system protein ParE